MKKRPVGNVVWDFVDGYLKCLACGDSYKINLPAPLDVVIASSKAYAKGHKRCKKESK